MVLLFLVVAAVAGMSVYVRRALEGRVRDTQIYALRQASAALKQTVPLGYEPYYAKSTAQTNQELRDESSFEYNTYLLNELSNVASVKDFEQNRSVVTNSEQLAPKSFNVTDF